MQIIWYQYKRVMQRVGGKQNMITSWNETLSALLALCEGNPPVSGGFPSQRASNVKLWCILWCSPEQMVKNSRFAGNFIRRPTPSCNVILMYQHHVQGWEYYLSMPQSQGNCVSNSGPRCYADAAVQYDVCIYFVWRFCMKVYILYISRCKLYGCNVICLSYFYIKIWKKKKKKIWRACFIWVNIAECAL